MLSEIPRMLIRGGTSKGPYANAAARLHDDQPGLVVVEHPAGKLETRMTMRKADGVEIPEFERAGIVRAARPLLAGVVHVVGPECRLRRDELSAV